MSNEKIVRVIRECVHEFMNEAKEKSEKYDKVKRGLNKLKKNQLKSLCHKRGVAVESDWNKSDCVEAIIGTVNQNDDTALSALEREFKE
jgi:hypothetical protein